MKRFLSVPRYGSICNHCLILSIMVDRKTRKAKRSGGGWKGGIKELALKHRRKPIIGGKDAAIVPVTHEVTPDHRTELLNGVILRFPISGVEEFLLHSCPHAFAASIVVAPAAGTVHALPDAAFAGSKTIFFTCVLASSVRMDNGSA